MMISRVLLIGALGLSFALCSAPGAEASGGSFLLPWLIATQTGCAPGNQPGECGPVDYTPAGKIGVTPGNYSDSSLVNIIRACHPSVIGMDWLSATDPELELNCELKLLEGLPLAESLVRPKSSVEAAARTNLALALQALLFLPLADGGGFFGDAGGDVYCPDIYQDYLFARPFSAFDSFKLKYSGGLDAAPGRKRVQFILERTEEFKFKEADDEDMIIASEFRGKITFRSNFTEIENPILLAATLVHESRHTDVGFGDGAGHGVCDFGHCRSEKKSCDSTHFGAYGVGNAYVEASIRAGIRTLTKEGVPLFSWDILESLYERVCERYLDRIKVKSEALANHFETVGCNPKRRDVDTSLSELYGLKLSEIWIQGQ
jgi:hypothetical protein